MNAVKPLRAHVAASRDVEVCARVSGESGGMLASSFIATLFIPSFFRWVSRREEKQSAGARSAD